LPFAIGAIWLLNRHPAPAPDGGTPVTLVPSPGSERRDGSQVDARRDRASWPPPPDRLDADPNPPSPTLLDQLVGIPKAAPPAHPAGSDRRGDAGKLGPPRQPPARRAAKPPAPPQPPAPAPATATPVARALDWLVRTQRPDGSWAPGEGGEPGLDTGTTALAL